MGDCGVNANTLVQNENINSDYSPLEDVDF